MRSNARDVCRSALAGFDELLDGFGDEALVSLAAKLGASHEPLRHWVRQAERDQGLRPGPTSTEQEKIKALEREVRELRQANEILRKASAYFAQAELDRRFKP